MKKIELYAFVMVLLFIGSCDLDKEPIPAYIHIKPFDLDINSNQGTKEQQLTDAWISSAETGDFLGVYELPATFPIIADGNTDLIIEPGILENGIKVTPNIYKFMTRFETSVDLAPGEIDTIQPITRYDPRVIFRYQEDFNSNNSLDLVIDTSIMINTDSFSAQEGAFEGSSVGFVLDENNPKIEVATSTQIELPTEGDVVVMEMHYKNDGILQVALLGYEDNNSTPVLTYFFALNPQSSWNKIYIDLTGTLIQYGTRFKTFRILFGAQLPQGQTTSTYLIDNIKVMEFPDN
jgi:hypothetical protein